MCDDSIYYVCITVHVECRSTHVRTRLKCDYVRHSEHIGDTRMHVSTTAGVWLIRLRISKRLAQNNSTILIFKLHF